MRGAAVVVAAVLLSGCGFHMAIRPEYFDRGQKAAVVLVHTESEIYPEPAEYHVPGQTLPVLPGGQKLDAVPVFAAIHPIIMEAMARNPHFRLVPEEKVLSTPAFRALPAAPPRWGYIVPKGYKWVTSDSAYPPVVRDAGADMGIGILLNLFYDRADGSAKMIVYVGILDAQGKGVWKGGTGADADRRVNVVAASERERIEAFKEVTRKAMAQVERAMTEELAAARGALTSARGARGS
jgi:hypothetical protein